MISHPATQYTLPISIRPLPCVPWGVLCRPWTKSKQGHSNLNDSNNLFLNSLSLSDWRKTLRFRFHVFIIGISDMNKGNSLCKEEKTAYFAFIFNSLVGINQCNFHELHHVDLLVDAFNHKWLQITVCKRRSWIQTLNELVVQSENVQ